MTFLFPGAAHTKRRPAVVVSTALYHQHRPDAVTGLLTTQTARATTPTGYILQDWQAAGLRQPSAFRAYFVTAEASDLTPIGDLSARDWQEVRSRLQPALAFS
jgi:mRNA interferase MazF